MKTSQRCSLVLSGSHLVYTTVQEVGNIMNSVLCRQLDLPFARCQLTNIQQALDTASKLFCFL
jgi:hypothetical protein